MLQNGYAKAIAGQPQERSRYFEDYKEAEQKASGERKVRRPVCPVGPGASSKEGEGQGEGGEHCPRPGHESGSWP